MKKLIAYFTAVIMTMAVFTGCNDSDKDKEKSESASKSDSASQIIEENIPEEIVPNAESDFQYREVTAEESAKDVGGIVITGYIGVSDNVVIPRTINGKQVVAIDPLAFCPYTEEKLLRIQDVESETSEDEKGLDLGKVFNKLNNIDTGNRRGDAWNYRCNDEEGLENFKRGLSNLLPLSSIKSIKIPTTIKAFGFGVFAFCGNLQSVEVYDMPSDKPLAIECKNCIFFACGSLEKVNFYPNNYGYGTEDEYACCFNLHTAYLYPDSSGNVNISELLCNNKKIKEIYIAEGTTGISDCKITRYVYMNDSIVEFLPLVLSEYGVETIHLPFSLREVGEHTFCTHTAEQIGGVTYDEYADSVCTGEINKNINIIAPVGSYAEQYAKEHGIMVNGVLYEIEKQTEAPTEPETEEVTEEQADVIRYDKRWKFVYWRAANQYNMSDPSAKYALLYIDADDLPELYIECSKENKTYLLGIYNGIVTHSENTFSNGK
ncbi:MAG: leucine-rich repeat protein [Ruminococcus sp.]